MPGTWEPDTSDSSFPHLFTILDVDDWEACGFDVVSPLRQAVLHAGGADDRELRLPASHSTSNICGIVAQPIGKVEPLKVAAARRAFGTLDVSYLLQLSLHLGLESNGLALVDHIAQLAKHCIDKCTDDMVVKILERRRLAYEDLVHGYL